MYFADDVLESKTARFPPFEWQAACYPNTMRSVCAVALACLILSSHRVQAQDEGPVHAAIADAAAQTSLTPDDPQSPAPRKIAFEYSDAYKTRAKIHKYASFATLPLFATELALGQSIYDNPNDGKKNAHIAIGTAIVGLYGVQAVTGVWNLVEANKDPNGHTRRMIHGILMLASGAGFAITPMLAPGGRERLTEGPSSAATHRAVALTSIGIGTAGYVMMIGWGK